MRTKKMEVDKPNSNGNYLPPKGSIEAFSSLSGEVLTMKPIKPPTSVGTIPSKRSVELKREQTKKLTERALKERALLACEDELTYLRHHGLNTNRLTQSCLPNPLNGQSPEGILL